MNLMTLLNKAKNSNTTLWLLNRLLWRMIPFNRPHRFRIAKISDHSLETLASHRRCNFNHIKGIHACAIATIAEFSAGLLLLMHIDVRQYRLILSELKVDYHYQAKRDIIARCTLIADELKMLFNELNENQVSQKTLTSEIYDQEKKHVATVFTTWQLKSWQQVRTKIN